MYQVYNTGLHSILGAPPGIPLGAPTQNLIYQTNSKQTAPALPERPGDNLPRALTYLADYGGCGFYRCMGPNLLLNLYQKSVIIESTAMIFDAKFYGMLSSVKFQRQATPMQAMFIEHLKKMFEKTKTRIIYELDDVVFAEDIPLYNRNRNAYTAPEMQQSVKKILNIADEIIVTTDYFRDYIINKTGNKNVSVIPNYLMKWWFDRYYNLGDLVKKYEKNKKKPRIAIFGSGTHVDVLKKCNLQDDFEAIVNHIIKTRNDFQWCFYGCYPLQLKPYIDEGKIEYHRWVQLPDYAATMAASNAQLTFAALRDNEFNRCKSNIKISEAGALGLPCICPDMVTYKDALLKYTTGDEFIDCIKTALKNQTVYADFCKKSRAFTEKYWLDDDQNLMKHQESYFTPYGSPARKFLS
jgi:hypothetical protein